MTQKRPTQRGLIRAFRGACYLVKGRYDQALADFSRVIELNPGEDDYIMKRAEIQRHIGPAEPTALQTAPFRSCHQHGGSRLPCASHCSGPGGRRHQARQGPGIHLMRTN